ncbi:MAG: tripartite tricarboxylate transporter substrate binding protein [Bacteroidota bacterium]
MRKGLLVAFLLVLVVSLVAASNYSDAKSKILTKPVTIVCPYSAGGGTDLMNRALAEGMKEYLGVQVNVVNMTGGLGGVATDYVWNKPHDGYLLLGASETNLFLPANGGHNTTTKDWEYFMAGGSPGVAMVAYNSKYQTFKDLVDDAKANPGKIKVAGSVMGGLWSTKWMVVAEAIGIETNVLGYGGSAPSITACMTGEVDVVHVSAGEALSYMQAKKLRPLIATEVKPVEIPGVGTVAPITDSYPELKKVLPMPQWLGFAVPADTPKKVLDEITKAFNAAMKHKAVKDMLASQLASSYGYSGKEAKKVAQDLESKFCWTLVKLNMAKTNPADLGIPKP